jgi:hypothetical protein
MELDITILKLRSEVTGRHFYSVVFSGDTDMVTDSWISLPSIEYREIIVTTVTPEEHQAANGFLRCERRVNTELRRSDLRAVWLQRVGSGGVLFYRDIFASRGEAAVVAEMPVAEFEREGGKIIHYAVA